MACAICQTRKPRRFCPGVRGDICTTCCGTEREMTVTCPFDCEYLQEARKHDRTTPVDVAKMANRDIRVSEEFIAEHEVLLMFLANAISKASLANSSLVDFDIREALEASIKTYRTLQSGLFYETLPDNPLAAGLCRTIQESVDEYRELEKQEAGMAKTRDSDVLGVLVFLQYFELDRNNNRRKGRAFLDALRGFYPAASDIEAPPSSSLILP